jgi:CubicO group peptidase (beta-lactamase class C family)
MPSESSFLKKQLMVAAGMFALSSCAGLETTQSSSLPAPSAQAGSTQRASMDAVLQRYIDEEVITGALVLVSEKGESWSTRRGLADREAKKPVEDDTIFRFYSMTKPITCAAVMTLYDDGLINLDAPIRQYLPEFSDMKVRTPAGLVPAERDITVRHLLTHTSGLSYEVMPGPVVQDYIDADVFAIRNRTSETLEEHVKRLAKLPLAMQPGSAWNYGESMGVLGRLVEVVSKKSYRDYLRERVLEPLDMDDTDFYAPPEKAGRLAELYVKSTSGALTNARDGAQYGGSYRVLPKLEYGGAGLVGTAGDYLNFGQMLLDGGMHGDRRILSERSVGMMMSNQLDPSLGSQPLAASGRAPGVGFGFCGFVVASRDETSPPGNVGEYGWGGWASTVFWVDPVRDLVGLIFTQTIPEVLGTISLGDDVRSIIYSQGD